MKLKSLLLIISLLMLKNLFSYNTIGLNFGLGLLQAYGSKEQAENYNIDINSLYGLRAGVFFKHPINEKLSLKQEVLFVQKGSKQQIKHKSEPVTLNVKYNLDYLEIPFILQYNLFKFKNITIYNETGFSFSYLLKANYSLDGKVFVGEEVFNINDSYKIKNLDEFDYSLLYGMGLEFPAYKVPVFIEYRFSLSWYKINFPTYENVENVQLSNQSHSISIGLPLF